MTTIAEKRDQDRDAVVFICDFSPPRGSDPALLEGAQQIGADFISVAYNPGKSTRVNSTLAASWIQANAAQDVLFALATRDMNKVAAESLLLGADLMGLPFQLDALDDIHNFPLAHPRELCYVAHVKEVLSLVPTRCNGLTRVCDKDTSCRGFAWRPLVGHC